MVTHNKLFTLTLPKLQLAFCLWSKTSNPKPGNNPSFDDKYAFFPFVEIVWNNDSDIHNIKLWSVATYFAVQVFSSDWNKMDQLWFDTLIAKLHTRKQI